MKTKICNMCYEVFGEIDIKTKHVFPKYKLINTQRKEDLTCIIEHYEKYDLNPHLSIFSFLCVFIEMEDHTDYTYFLSVILRLCEKMYKEKQEQTKSFIVIDFGYIFQKIINVKSDSEFSSCKVINNFFRFGLLKNQKKNMLKL